MNGCMFRLTALLLSVSTLFACTSPSVHLQFQAGPKLNPNPQGQAEPVLVRLFELNEIDPFLHADYESLALHEKATLGNSLIARHETILSPNSQRNLSIHLNKRTRILGFLFLLREATNPWRRIVFLPSPASLKISNTIAVQIQQNQLIIKAPTWWKTLNLFGPKV